MRILIVEDEVKIRMGISKLITAVTKHEVVGEAKNGKEGLEFIIRYKPDLVITDIKMPEMDGLQMLSELKEMGISLHAIILSGYAEFDYAKRAISLGVNDYLLKPIGMEELTELLDNMEQKIAKESEEKGTKESYLRDIYLNGDSDNTALYQKLEVCMKKKAGYVLYLGYIGAAPITYREEFENKIKQGMEGYKDSITISYIDKFQEILCLVEEGEKEKKFYDFFERKIIRAYLKKEEQAVWSMMSFQRVEELSFVIKRLQELLMYGMIKNGDIILTEEAINNFKLEECVYPIELENTLKVALCGGNKKRIEQEITKFILYMREHMFSPQNIKHCYLKYTTFLSNLLQEIDKKNYEQLQKRNILKKIADARTKYEMEFILQEMSRFLQNMQEKKEDIHNYTIKRAINFIREHYMEGITLEEVARKLDITPEYLSTLFYKEMEINFSTFLKQFRISHAKRLLKGTEMKIYEIAESVGYQDPKYFMRVFKEEQGISPKEYRSRS